jgi:predicted amidohydrolase YtcJ
MRSPDDVLGAIRSEVAARGASGAYLNGWDPLLQVGLPAPTLAWLDDLAPDTPLVIIHNSGHLAYFNSAGARQQGLNRDTPDPKGAKYGRDANGELDGTAEETGAVFPLIGGAIDPNGYPAMLLAECARLNRAGLTMCSEMAFDPMFQPVLDALRVDLPVRLRTYEMSTAQMSTTQTVDNGDDVVRQVGIKIWVDGSPWIGNIDLSFPYLDTEATRIIGVTPGSCGHANYTREQLAEIVAAYFPLGWQMACHVQGDAGVDTILDVYQEALRANPRRDHRLRLEHVGAISNEQLQRAHDMGVTCSIFVDQIHYWGDVIVDGLFGPEHGSRWMPAGSAVATGMRISLHNDPPVTPEEPLRNISVAVTRVAPSGRVLGPEERLTVEQAIRAQTIDAAWQLQSEDVVGSLEVGKYADMVVLSADPRTVPPETIADLVVRATYLAGRRVYAKSD